MAKAFMNKRRTLTAVLAVMLTAVILLGGTFAWQSISQQALNEISATVNPGGRLHDDFVEITNTGDYKTMTFNKDVYTENFTSRTNNGVQVFARVRLDEYMEIGTGAGNETTELNNATPLVAGTRLDDKNTWSTYKYGDHTSAYRKYFAMSFGGKTVYMPTFNKDMNSLEADINGTFKANFTDHTDYTLGQELTADATYAGQDENDEIITKTVEETHTATETLNALVISMEKWIEGGKHTGNFWVYDNDGWAYWANPIDPDTATGLLLDGINRTEEIVNDDWYYAINVVAQFITYDDIGAEDGTGFYDTTAGTVPTANALDLLNNIGVKVNFKVDSAEELETALTNGGTVTLTKDIALDKALTVKKDTVLNLGNNKITYNGENDLYDLDTKTWSLISADGATLIINGTGSIVAKENDSYCVDVKNGGKVVINGGNFVGNISAVYVREGEAVIYGGTFDVKQLSEVTNDKSFMLNCEDENYANGTAKITVCGGTFTGFNPEKSNDGSFVPGGYVVSENNGSYTVNKK